MHFHPVLKFEIYSLLLLTSSILSFSCKYAEHTWTELTQFLCEKKNEERRTEIGGGEKKWECAAVVGRQSACNIPNYIPLEHEIAFEMQSIAWNKMSCNCGCASNPFFGCTTQLHNNNATLRFALTHTHTHMYDWQWTENVNFISLTRIKMNNTLFNTLNSFWYAQPNQRPSE